MIDIELPLDVYDNLVAIGDLAGVTVDDVINVILATKLIEVKPVVELEEIHLDEDRASGAV